MPRYKLPDGTIYNIPEEKVDSFLQKFPDAVIETPGKIAPPQRDQAGMLVEVSPIPAATGLSLEPFSLDSQEQDTAIERAFGKNSITDFFGDIYRAASKGLEQASLVDPSINLYREGAEASDKTILDFIESNKSVNKNIMQSDEMREFNRIYEEEGGGWWGFVKGAALNPSVLTQELVSSIAMQIGALKSDEVAASATGGLITGAAGAGLATGGVLAVPGGIAGAMGGAMAALETGLTFSELLNKELGDNLTVENVRAFLQNEEKLSDLKNKALGRGLTIGAIELATMGIAKGVGGKIAKAGFKRAGLAAGAAIGGIEIAGGGIGEVAGRFVAGQEMDIAEIGFEAFAGLGSAPISILGQSKNISKGIARIKIDKELANTKYKNISDLFLNEEKTSDAFINLTKIKNAEEIFIEEINNKVKNKSLTKEQGNDAKEKFKRTIEINKKLDILEYDESNRNEIIDLFIEKNNLKNKIAKVGEKTLTTLYYDRVQEIDTRLEEIAKVNTEKSLKKSVSFAEKAGEALGLKTEVLSQEEILKEYGKEEADSEGFIRNGKIVINKDIAPSLEKVTVGSHEVLHGILNEALKGKEASKIVNQFKKIIGKEQLAKVEERLFAKDKNGVRLYSDEYIAANPDEYFTLFSDAILKNEIKYNENIFTKLGDLIRPILRKLGFSKIKFETGRDVYNFLKEYNNSVKKGELSKDILDLNIKVKSDINAFSKSPQADKVQEIYNEKGKEGAFDIIQAYKPLTSKLTNKYKNVPGFDFELLQSEIEIGKRGLLDIINAYDPSKGATLNTYIQGQLANRSIEAANRILDTDFKLDVTEVKGIADIATIEKENITTETKKYKNLLESKIVEKDIIENISKKILSTIRVLKNKIDTQVSINRTVTPLISEIKEEIGKQADIDIKKAMGGAKNNVLKNFLLKNKKSILENMTTTWLMGQDTGTIVKGGIPIAIQKQIDGKFIDYPNWIGKKIDREKVSTDKAGRTSGADIVRRKPNAANIISDNDFLSFILQPDGNPIRGRKESLAKAIAEELSFDIIQSEFETNGILYNAFKDNQLRLGVEISAITLNNIAKQIERGNIKFSKPTKGDLNIILNASEKTNVNEKIGIEIFTKAINLGIDTEEFDKFTKTIDLSEELIKLFLDNLINEGIIAAAQRSIARNAGIKYEKGISSFLSRILKNKASVKIVNYTKGDIEITIDGVSYLIELKLNKNSQVGSLSFKNLLNENGLNTNYELSKTTREENNIKNLLKENKKYFDNFINAIKQAENETGLKVEYTKTGNLKLPNKSFWDIIRKYMPNGIFGTLNFESDASIISDLYNPVGDDPNVGLIHIGPGLGFDGGMYRVGELNALNAEFSELDAEINNVIRPTRNGKIIYWRLFPNFLKINNKAENSLEKIEGLNKLAKASERVNYSTQYSKSPNKKLRIFDFDDTLARSKSNVLYTMPNGTKGKLNAEQFAKQSDELQEQGAIFDFSEFSKVIEGQKGPMFDVAKAILDKRGDEDLFILTARPPEAKYAIQPFLEGLGLPFRLENIIGLGNGSPQAKADWIASKLNLGYNDVYFADDALKNVQAVAETLSAYDIKYRSQQVKFSKSLDKDFNKLIEDTTGVDWYKEYSPVKAELLGRKKGKGKFFIPYSADDFVGLLYTTLAKGKTGEAQMEWYKENLLQPFSRGIQQYEAAKQKAMREWALLKKEIKKDIPAGLNKENETGFRNQDSVRIYIWHTQGVDMTSKEKGLSKSDLNENLKYVRKNPKLKSFADKLMALNNEGYPAPSNNWNVGDITTDLISYVNDVKRKEYLQEWKDNSDIIFSDKNKNKLKALYGDRYIEALDDMLFRMWNGRNKSVGVGRIERSFQNWVNNSVGTIMFFNSRSALLQTISAVNFINFTDNNPINAALAFANQKQYWADFSELFNSDFLKQRRSGLQTDINADEIANAAATSTNKAKAVLSAILKFGFTPTQIADSFAIASGGATFYRNRINKYLKEGMSLEEAKKQAFADFQEIAEESQQSARPDRISMQQASSLGRIILAFGNTPMQYARLTKKAALDLINNRGDWKTNISKIMYYSVIQNIIFSALQQGLFALLFSDEEDDEEKSRYFRIANSSIDTFLRGVGVYGAAAATVKNMVLKVIEESEKSRPDYTQVAIESTAISPPINSKLRKLISAGKTFTYKQSKEKVFTEGFSLENPAFLAAGQVISAGTNLPADRLITKADHIYTAIQPETELWQSIALSLGWSEWDLGMIEKQTKSSKKSFNPRDAKRTTSRSVKRKVER